MRGLWGDIYEEIPPMFPTSTGLAYVGSKKNFWSSGYQNVTTAGVSASWKLQILARPKSASLFHHLSPKCSLALGLGERRSEHEGNLGLLETGASDLWWSPPPFQPWWGCLVLVGPEVLVHIFTHQDHSGLPTSSGCGTEVQQAPSRALICSWGPQSGHCGDYGPCTPSHRHQH